MSGKVSNQRFVNSCLTNSPSVYLTIIHRGGGGWVWILVSLHNHDGDGNEYSKKAIDLDKQNNNFARASSFFVHFSAVVARLQRETA